MNVNIQEISITPFQDQKPGTSGLRKKTPVFMEEHYVESFIQATLNVVKRKDRADLSSEAIIIGGDGRYYNREAIQKIIKVLVANEVKAVLVAKGGILSTPAMSAMIRAKYTLGGFILSASHNPGGPKEDFGIKYNISNGGPAPEAYTNDIFEEAKSLSSYLTIENNTIDLDTLGTHTLGSSNIVVLDGLTDYISLLKEVFDFPALKKLLSGDFKMRFDAMNAVTGPYAKEIFENELSAPQGSVIRSVPLEDFGGAHPDPNLVHASELVEELFSDDGPDFGAASDGDGDRNLILGKDCFVSPGDSLAVIVEHAQNCIPGYKEGLKGVARSMPTSMAVDKVADSLGIKTYETPTGWKFFGSLMDEELVSICGEESFGTSSSHVREKDGIWAVLCWLSIIRKNWSLC